VTPPPITIACECGTSGTVPYGERWTCEECGRRWNTAQIPADAYAQRLKRMRRFRLEVIAFVVVALAVFVPLVAFVDASFMFLGLLAGLAWVFLYMPFWRRRVRRAVADAPSWQLSPE
jgi:hypothetical protein